MAGILYIVPTPIGNLEDMTFRAIQTLKDVDLILAEDTRTSAKLLRHFEISTPMKANHMHNEHQKSAQYVEQILAGHNVALISDAGTPAISDPGFLLTRACVENNIEVSKKIASGKFKMSEMEKYAKDKNLKIESKRITNLKDNKIFNEDIIKEIFKMSDNQMNLLTDSTLSKNFLVYIEKTENIKLNKDSKDYKKYRLQANLSFARDIFKTYDKSVNDKYKIDINNKAIDRLKNSF